MRIKNLQLENFRGFEKLDIEFPTDSNVAVFIGENGSGKSSLLDAIKANLGIFIEKFKYELTDDDVNIRIKKANEIYSHFFENDLKNKIQIEQNSLFNLTADCVQPEYLFSWSTEKKLGREGAILNIGNNTPMDDYEKVIRDIKYIWKNNFIFNYFELRKDIDNINVSFQKFSLWFEKEAHLENQIRLEKDINFRDPILTIFRETIQTYFSYLDKDTVFSNLNVKTERIVLNKNYINLESNHIESYLKIDKNGETFKLSQLSSGEKSILLLVFELVQDMIVLNRSDVNRHFQPGIVLIDEIELHLHPKWQRNIVPALTKTFPNIQFIITTHSPQVLSYVPNGSAFSIENGNAHPVHTYGRDNEWILETIMNDIARPKEIREKLDQLFDYIKANHLDEAKQLRKEIASIIGEDEGELLKADILIQRKNRAVTNEAH